MSQNYDNRLEKFTDVIWSIQDFEHYKILTNQVTNIFLYKINKTNDFDKIIKDANEMILEVNSLQNILLALKYSCDYILLEYNSDLIQNIVTILSQYPKMYTKIIVKNVTQVDNLLLCMKLGVDIIEVSNSFFLLDH